MKPDIVIAFAFGKFFGKFKEGVNPNWQIARRAKSLAKENKVPIFTQQDIVWEYGASRNEIEIYLAQETSGGYLSTLGIIRQFAKLARQKGWKKVLVVAAQPRIKRCVQDLRRTGFEVRKDKYLEVTFHSGYWYNRNSSQFWTRFRVFWWLREIPLRLMPWRLYKKITG